MLAILASTRVFDANEMVVAEEVLDAYLQEGEDSGFFCYVLVHEERIQGYVCFGPTPLTYGTWDIYWMAVHASAHRLGVGKQLLAFAEREIQEKRGRLCLIETSSRADYEPARRFYSSMGYQVECIVDGFYSPGDSKVLFAKRFTYQPP